MSDMMNLIKAFREKDCPCGQKHDTSVQDIRIGSGLVHTVGNILKQNGFCRDLLLVADRQTLAAAAGIEESLKDFSVQYKIYDQIRVAEMSHVEELESLLNGREIAVLAVGSGSVHDPCRLAAARTGKKLCLFATAPSMDGFASDTAPIVKEGFKSSYKAKSPEVIIGDTAILAKAPKELKSAGFGDMIAKYVALVDWRISNLLTGEPCCERVASLTREATDELMAMADRVTADDEETAGKIFESLIKTGVGMSFTGNSRPASGAEHIVAHLIECVQLRDGILPNYHGEDVGVATLAVLKTYGELAERESINTCDDAPDWEDIYAFYGSMADEVKRLNTSPTVIEGVDKETLKVCWPQIRAIIKSVPSYDECLAAMKQAGCKVTVADIGKDPALFDACLHYSPYMRNRLTLLRLKDMIV